MAKRARNPACTDEEHAPMPNVIDPMRQKIAD
jgi:hypothetical protein